VFDVVQFLKLMERKNPSLGILEFGVGILPCPDAPPEKIRANAQEGTRVGRPVALFVRKAQAIHFLGWELSVWF